MLLLPPPIYIHSKKTKKPKGEFLKTLENNFNLEGFEAKNYLARLDVHLQISNYLEYVIHALNTFEAKVFPHLIVLPDIELPVLNHRPRRVIKVTSYKGVYGEAEVASKELEGFYTCLSSKALERAATNPIATGKFLKSRAYQDKQKLKVLEQTAKASFTILPNSYLSKVTSREYIKRLSTKELALSLVELYQLELVEQYQLQEDNKNLALHFKRLPKGCR